MFKLVVTIPSVLGEMNSLQLIDLSQKIEKAIVPNSSDSKKHDKMLTRPDAFDNIICHASWLFLIDFPFLHKKNRLSMNLESLSPPIVVLGIFENSNLET